MPVLHRLTPREAYAAHMLGSLLIDGTLERQLHELNRAMLG